MEDIKKQVGANIRKARKAKGLTQSELGEKLGITESAVGRYENGQNFTVDTLLRVAQQLETTVTELVKEF